MSILSKKPLSQTLKKMNNQENKAFSIKEILTENHYIIPIYQRNYAWGKEEIAQLISDINDYFSGDEKDKAYYLGSLICFKRENNYYELLDGQQRHTTLTLINAVLKELKKDCVTTTNLKFDSRKNIQNFIENLYQTNNLEAFIKNTTDSSVANFISAIDIIREELSAIENINEFAQNFYEKVKLFRVEVPEETDLNHYFEIMNNRGEQLEKHEILKAKLMGKLDNDAEKSAFAEIWDACSDMTNYVWLNFDSIKRNLFDEKQLDFFNQIMEKDGSVKEGQSSEESTLEKILETHKTDKNFNQNEGKFSDKYKSVIDFPNFLLQVLKATHKNGASLDDKKLLSEFNNVSDAKTFITNLLEYRIKFDKYIIKQDDSSTPNWGIRTLNNAKDSEVNTFPDDTKTKEELVNLQTMFYYSNPSNSNNNWVQLVLKQDEFNADKLIKMLFDHAKERFNLNNKLSYPEVPIFNFYFIEFLLWRKYKEGIQGITSTNPFDSDTLEYKIFEKRNGFQTFKFRQLNSKEHLYPQSYKEIKNSNSIGNLCLISTNQNSQGNKESPAQKRERYKDENSSLKRLIMFQSFDSDTWKEEQIEKHENEIITLLNEFGVQIPNGEVFDIANQ